MEIEKPQIRCVVGYLLPDGGVRACSHIVTLEEAAVLASYGWIVMDDPFDREDLTRYEQVQRALSQRTSWNTLILRKGH